MVGIKFFLGMIVMIVMVLAPHHFVRKNVDLNKIPSTFKETTKIENNHNQNKTEEYGQVQGEANPMDSKMALAYTQISAQQAKEMMDSEKDYIILDVRSKGEFDGAHIPGAVLLPNETIGAEMPKELKDKNQLILIYCRSGNRSKQAAQKLVDLGYTNIYEFGGINSWPYDLEQ